MEIPREDIVWVAGIYQRPGLWNPLGWARSFVTFFMYEPLFTKNMATGELGGIIGENIGWVDPLTIEIKIRDEAMWSDGTPITADDVIYTLDNLYVRHLRASGYDWERDWVEAVSDKVVRVHLLEEYANSRSVWNYLTSGTYLIAPKHVWTEIEKEEGEFPYQYAFANDWAEIKDEWKVASGMYLPYYWDTHTEIGIRNDNWWGKEVWRIPEPNYLGVKYYESNVGMNQEFEKGKTDWYGGFFPRIWELAGKPTGEYINTWTMRKPPFYLPLNAHVCLVFNHNEYPLNEPWLHHAIAYAIDYEDTSWRSASGYLEQALVNFLSPEVPEHARLMDNDVIERYQPHYDPEKAVEILGEHCIKRNGEWYTKDAPDSWRGVTIGDELPDVQGRNVKLGPWEIMVVYGWTDSMMQTTLISSNLSSIGIKADPNMREYGSFVPKMTSMDFKLMLFPAGPEVINSILEVYTALFRGPPGQWQNYAAYDHPNYLAEELDNLLTQLEFTPKETPEEEEIVKRLQEIVARDLPMIPMFYNGYWYTFSTMYWHNWPCEENPYVFPCAPWETIWAGNLQTLIRNLEKGPKPMDLDELPWVVPETPNGDDTGGTSWGHIGAIIAIVAATICIIVIARRRA